MHAGRARCAGLALAGACLLGAAQARAEPEDAAGAAIPRCGAGLPVPGPDATRDAERARLLEPPARPMRVVVALHVNELENLNVLENQASFSGYAEFRWCDPRLAFDAREAGVAIRRFVGERAVAQLGQMWQPDLTLGNGIGPPRVSKRVLDIAADGSVALEGLFDAEIAVDYDLRRFPLDRQVVPIEVESFSWNAEQVQLAFEDERVGYDEKIAIPEWRIIGMRYRDETVQVARDDRPFSRLVVELRVSREVGFYVFKVALPLCLIVALSWAVFWVDDENFAGRTRMSSTGVLTIVAYQFAIGSALPRVSYLTLMDKLMIAAFTLIAVTVLENLLVANQRRHDPARAARIDAISRWLFPVGFVSIGALILLSGRG